MELRVLNLNCQHAYQPSFSRFFKEALAARTYDIYLLEEANESVRALITGSEYTIVDFAEGTSWPKVLIRKDHVLIDSFTLPFENDEIPAYGVSFAEVSIAGEAIVFGVTHLRAGFSAPKRREQAELLKETIRERYSGKPLLLAGDFNTGFPGEYVLMKYLFAPELLNVSEHLGPTIESRYAEDSRFFASKMAVTLGRLGVNLRLKLDHVYASRELLAKVSTTCGKLAERVSDHSGVEIALTSNLRK